MAARAMGVAPHRHLPERPPLVSVEVHPAAADRFPDVATILAPAKPSTPAPAVIAYVDGVPAGWCSFGPRSSFNRLVKSRTIPHVDETPAWSVICFIVRPQFRRTGLSRALLDAVVDYAKGRSDVSVLEVGRAQKTIFCARYLHPRPAAGRSRKGSTCDEVLQRRERRHHLRSMQGFVHQRIVPFLTLVSCR